jgi:hypothetical protein
MSNEGQEQLNWFDMAFKQLTEVIPVIGTRSVDVLGKLAEVIPKVGRVCDHASVFLSKATERLDKPIETRFDQKQLNQLVDDTGEMLADLLQGATLMVAVSEGKVRTRTSTDESAKVDEVLAEETVVTTPVSVITVTPNMVVEALKASTVPQAPQVDESSTKPVIPAVTQEVATRPRVDVPASLSVALSVIGPRSDCADCMSIEMLCEVHVKDQTIVDEAALEMSSWLDDRDADGSLTREPLLRHFKRLDFATKALGDKCNRDCMSCGRVTDAGIPRPVQCLRDVAKLVPVVSG